jgi:DNA-binding IclR family transcriptional regulator
MSNLPPLQGTIDVIHRVIKAIGPAPAREIERHPEVVQACRSSKLKARRLIERLHKMGYVKSDEAQQMPRFSVSL